MKYSGCAHLSPLGPTHGHHKVHITLPSDCGPRSWQIPWVNQRLNLPLLFFFSLGQALWLAGSGPLPVKVPNPNHRISREVPWTYHFLTPRRVNWRVKNKAGSQPGIFIPSTNVYRALTVCQAHYVLDVGNEKGVGGKSWHYDSAALWFQKSVWTSVTHDTLWNRKFRMYTVDLVISLPDIWSSKTLAWVQRELCVRLTLKHYF